MAAMATAHYSDLIGQCQSIDSALIVQRAVRPQSPAFDQCSSEDFANIRIVLISPIEKTLGGGYPTW